MPTVKIVCISDTHTMHNEIVLPPADMLLVAGDFCGSGRKLREIEDFDEWLGTQNIPVKIVVAGNHDMLFESKPRQAQALLKHAKYLQDDETTIRPTLVGQEGDWRLRVYGTPWQPRYYDWGFNLDRNGYELADKWRKIPTKVDILVTHSPPFGILDPNPYGDRVGCELLTSELDRIKPKLHVFGHLHSGYGIVERKGTIFVNAAICDELYRVHREPLVVELEV